MRFALRRLMKFPGTTLISVTLLAVAIGATTASVSLATAYLFTPMFPGQAKLYVFWPELASGNRVEIAYPEFFDWEKELDGFSDLAVMWSSTLQRVVPVEGGGEAVPFRWVSSTFFDTLGVFPILGRGFAPVDAEPGTDCVAVVSFGLWRSRFGGRSDVLGAALEGDDPCTIIGVMPRGFGFPRGVELWLPLRRNREVMNRELGVLFGVGRLAEGVDPENARAELDALNARLDEEQVGITMPVTMKMRPILEEQLGSGTAPTLMSLLTGVALLLLIACANVSAIGATRALSRRKEIRTERALGASRVRIAVEHLSESALVAGSGAVLGVALAKGLILLLPALQPPSLPHLDRVELSPTVLAASLAAAALATLLPGLVAASAGRRERRGRAREGLIVGEVALAMVLLTGTGLSLRSFAAIRGIDVGFDEANVLTAVLVSPSYGKSKLEERRGLVKTVVSRLRSLPGVRSAAAVLVRPFELGGGGWGSYLLLEGETPESDAFTRNPEVNFQAVTPDYFHTVGLRLLEGRDFSERDDDDAPRVAIVSRALAQRLWPEQEPVGKRLLSSFGSKTFGESGEPRFQTVVGVVEDARYRGVLLPNFDLYVPYRQANPQPMSIVLRTTVPPEATAPLVRNTISDIDPSIAIDAMTTLDAIVARELRPWSFGVRLFSFLGLLAASLAALGLFGLLALGVRERRRELGLRAALGADPGRLWRGLVARGAALCALGVPIGLGGSIVFFRAFRSLLYAVRPDDGVALLGAASVLFMLSFIGSLVPARQASRIAPAEALRHE